MKKDKNGQTKAVNAAREQAENLSRKSPGQDWDAYVEDASKYYGFDASQVAAAQSLVRDYKARAIVAAGGEESWRTRHYQIGFGLGMIQRLTPSVQEGVRSLLYQDLIEVRQSLKGLSDELFDKIEAIATRAQREAAERRITEALAAAGFDIEKETAPAPALAIHQENTVDQPTQK